MLGRRIGTETRRKERLILDNKSPHLLVLSTPAVAVRGLDMFIQYHTMDDALVEGNYRDALSRHLQMT